MALEGLREFSLHDYLLRTVSDIRGVAQDRAASSAGWAMGPFYPSTKLAFTTDLGGLQRLPVHFPSHVFCF